MDLALAVGVRCEQFFPQRLKSLANQPLYAEFANYQPDSALALIRLSGENDL
jgi:hypothetical protein